jgi:hypothetical protein
MAMTGPTAAQRRLVPPGSTPLLELAHAIAGALTLPGDVAERDELDYLRASRDHARIVLFAMRRIIADRDLDEDDVMTIAASIRHRTTQLATGDTTPADPLSAFIEAVIAALSIAPAAPQSELAYLQSARQRARRVLLACRRAIEGARIEDADLAAAAGMLTAGSDGGQGSGEAAPEIAP